MRLLKSDICLVCFFFYYYSLSYIFFAIDRIIITIEKLDLLLNKSIYIMKQEIDFFLCKYVFELADKIQLLTGYKPTKKRIKLTKIYKHMLCK